MSLLIARSRTLLLGTALGLLGAGFGVFLVLRSGQADGAKRAERPATGESLVRIESPERTGPGERDEVPGGLLAVIDRLATAQRDLVLKVEEIRVILVDLRSAMQDPGAAMGGEISPKAWRRMQMAAERRLIVQEIARVRLDLLLRIQSCRRRLAQGSGRVPEGESEQPLLDSIRRDLQKALVTLAALDGAKIRTVEDLAAFTYTRK